MLALMYKSKQNKILHMWVWNLVSLSEGRTEIEGILRIKRQRETFLLMKLTKWLKEKLN